VKKKLDAFKFFEHRLLHDIRLPPGKGLESDDDWLRRRRARAESEK